MILKVRNDPKGRLDENRLNIGSFGGRNLEEHSTVGAGEFGGLLWRYLNLFLEVYFIPRNHYSDFLMAIFLNVAEPLFEI